MNKIIVLVTVAFISNLIVAEQNIQNMDQQFMQMMQRRAEENAREEEFKNPKKPKLDPSRAVLGSRSAKIHIIEYSDFQCPYCKKGAEVLKEVKEKYKGKIMVQFKNLPLPFHPFAMPASKVFEAIALQDAKKAYAFHDAVFASQESLGQGDAFLFETAKKVGANVEQVKKDMNSDKVKKRIEEDMEEAKSFGIQGTPGFLVMGVAVKGAYPKEEFFSIIEKRLADKSKK